MNLLAKLGLKEPKEKTPYEPRIRILDRSAGGTDAGNHPDIQYTVIARMGYPFNTLTYPPQYTVRVVIRRGARNEARVDVLDDGEWKEIADEPISEWYSRTEVHIATPPDIQERMDWLVDRLLNRALKILVH